ncbi:MAG: DUF2203 domain-containing protein [Acidobacteriota bacterium]|nr:DUF2203 domain-containing protein [Acidobacteriota bacterium]
MDDSSRTFSYREAISTLPLVHQLTHAAVSQIEALFNRVQSREEMERRQDELQLSMDTIVRQWTLEVTKLGCEVKGLWLVDWDSGDGYYCWRYPESTISFFHAYEDGFAGRVPIN